MPRPRPMTVTAQPEARGPACGETEERDWARCEARGSAESLTGLAPHSAGRQAGARQLARPAPTHVARTSSAEAPAPKRQRGDASRAALPAPPVLPASVPSPPTSHAAGSPRAGPRLLA
eukprot:scaffold45460_cov67-Phaeocystis_antarctica.AAC.10